MYKTRLLNLILVAVLIVAAAAAIKGITPSRGAAKSIPTTGMGDLHQVEAQPSILNWELKRSPRYTGMGDWRRFEVQQEIRASSALESNLASVGMGDVHSAERPAVSSITGALYARSIGTLASSSAGVGMGDLHSLETQHSLSLQRSQEADAARWKAMGEYNLAKQAQALQRSWEADAARLTGLAFVNRPPALIPNTGALERRPDYNGMGDLQITDAQNFHFNDGRQDSAGMGDLQNYDAKSSTPVPTYYFNDKRQD